MFVSIRWPVKIPKDLFKALPLGFALGPSDHLVSDPKIPNLPKTVVSSCFGSKENLHVPGRSLFFDDLRTGAVVFAFHVPPGAGGNISLFVSESVAQPCRAGR